MCIVEVLSICKSHRIMLFSRYFGYICETENGVMYDNIVSHSPHKGFLDYGRGINSEIIQG